jgi:class 3 adenylate cyclase
MDLHGREGFIDYLPISMRDLLAGRVSGRPLYPEAEMFKNLPYYLRIGNEADYFHLSSAARTRKLTAILSADVEGYSRLMREDEDATIRTLTAYRASRLPTRKTTRPCQTPTNR